MATTTEAARDGRAAGATVSYAQRIASRDHRTMRDMANSTFEAGVGMLQDQIGVREGNGFIRAVSETRKLIVDGQRIGYQKDVLDSPGVQPDGDEVLRRREAQLTADLEATREQREAIRERRGA